MDQVTKNLNAAIATMHEPVANQFRVGVVWETTRGHLYRVVEVRRGGQAILRAGATGERGRIVRK